MYFVYTNNPKKSITSPSRSGTIQGGVYRRVRTRVPCRSNYFILSLASVQLGPFTTTNTLNLIFIFRIF